MMANNNPLAIQRRGRKTHAGPEKQYEEKIKTLLREMGCQVEKLHGSEYQAGLPDLLVLTPHRKLRLIEIKWSKRDPVILGDLFLMLKDRQKSLLPLWGRKGAPIFVLCGCPSGKHYAAHTGCRDLDGALSSGALDRVLGEIIHG